MFNRNTTWKRPNDSHRFQTICASCMILMGQFATAQDTLLPSQPADAPSPLTLSRIGSSVAGERIVSVTCDPFMSQVQEHALMRLLLEQDDAPWINISLNQLKDRLSNECTVWIDEESLEEISIRIDQMLMNEVPTGVLGARLSALLGSHQLAYTVRQNRLEISSIRSKDSGIRRIYDVTPLVRTVNNGPGSPSIVLAHPLVGIIESTVCPDSWQSAGGNCTIREFIPPCSSDCVCLIVVNSTENHLAIQNLLDQLNSFGVPSRLVNVVPKKPVQAFQLKRWQADRLDTSKF